MKARILLVEDESALAMIIAETLEGEGFDVDVAADGIDGLSMFARGNYDAVVADVMMPRLDGFEMGRRIRRLDSEVPLLFLTAKSTIDDIVEGFELGANDYLKKPFKMLELIVRLKALMRSRGIGIASGRGNERHEFRLGRYRYNPVSQTLAIDGQVSDLSHFEAVILTELAENVNMTVAAGELMMKVWQKDDIYNRNSLHGFIHKLRRHLRHDPAIAIINLRGIGYKLIISGDGDGD